MLQIGPQGPSFHGATLGVDSSKFREGEGQQLEPQGSGADFFLLAGACEEVAGAAGDARCQGEGMRWIGGGIGIWGKRSCFSFLGFWGFWWTSTLFQPVGCFLCWGSWVPIPSKSANQEKVQSLVFPWKSFWHLSRCSGTWRSQWLEPRKGCRTRSFGGESPGPLFWAAKRCPQKAQQRAAPKTDSHYPGFPASGAKGSSQSCKFHLPT